MESVYLTATHQSRTDSATLRSVKKLQNSQLLKSSPTRPLPKMPTCTQEQDLRFHPTCGSNIVIQEGNQAKFCPTVSGGICFSDQDLKQGQSVNLKIDGSGHVDVGVTTKEPASMTAHIPQCTRDLQSSYVQLNEIRQHRRQCSIELKRSTNGGQLIESHYSGKKYTKKVDGTKPYWIVVYTRFGNVNVKFSTSDPGQSLFQFSKHHGSNIELCDGKMAVQSLNPNPFSLCFVDRKLTAGSTVLFQCSPNNNNGNPPSRYHIILGVCLQDPASVGQSYPSLFKVTHPRVSESPVTNIEVLDKQECCGITGQQGIVTISFKDNNTVSYISATGKVNTTRLNFDTSAGVWLVLELYRVSVTLAVPEHSQQITPCQQDRHSTSADERTSPKVFAGTDHVDASHERKADGTTETVPKVFAGTDHIDASIERRAVITTANHRPVQRQESDYVKIKSFVDPISLTDRVDTLEVKVEKLELSQPTCTGRHCSNMCQGGGRGPVFDNTSSGQQPSSSTMSPKSPTSPLNRCPHSPGAMTPDDVPPHNAVYVTEEQIRRSWTNLLRDVISSSLSDHLYQAEYLSYDELDQIKTTELRSGQKPANELLLQKVSKKHISIDAWHKLLEESSQGHLKKFFPLQ